MKNSLLLALLFAFACNAAIITGQAIGAAEDDIMVLNSAKVQRKKCIALGIRTHQNEWDEQTWQG